MPFDPSQPADGSPLSSAAMRSQLNALNAKINSIPQGPPGPQGGPGEVSQAALDAAIADTARNPSGIAQLGFAISDPPTQSEVQAILDAYNALLAALLR